jgi:heme A synthase
VPTAFAAPACRRPIVLIAAWLIVLQAFLAGVAAAQDAAMAASDPLNAIAGANDGTAPQSAKIEHPCCAHCISAAPAIAPPDAPRAAPPQLASRPFAWSSFTVVIAHGAVRAGPSRAPPTPA